MPVNGYVIGQAHWREFIYRRRDGLMRTPPSIPGRGYCNHKRDSQPTPRLPRTNRLADRTMKRIIRRHYFFRFAYSTVARRNRFISIVVPRLRRVVDFGAKPVADFWDGFYELG